MFCSAASLHPIHMKELAYVEGQILGWHQAAQLCWNQCKWPKDIAWSVYCSDTWLYLHKEALVTHSVTEAHWLILKLLIWCKRKFSHFTGEQDLVARLCMRNGEQRQCKKTNTEKVSHPALYLKAPRSPSSNISAQIQTVNRYLHELVNYSFVMCPAKSCQAPLFEVVNPLAQAAGVQPLVWGCQSRACESCRSCSAWIRGNCTESLGLWLTWGRQNRALTGGCRSLEGSGGGVAVQ